MPPHFKTAVPPDSFLPVEKNNPVRVDEEFMTMPVKPAPSADRANKNSGPERQAYSDRKTRIPEPWRRAGRIPPWPIDPARIIDRNINDLGFNRQDGNVPTLDVHLLSVGRLQIPLGSGLCPEVLDDVHHFISLLQEGVTQLSRFIEPLAHGIQHLRETAKGFNARVPRSIPKGFIQSLSPEAWILLKPSIRFNHLEWIG
jgi:hypothetical protein